MAATDTRVADLEEIRALTHRYGLALDTFDLDGIVGVFTPDGTFDCTAFGLEVCDGSESIRAFFAHNQQVMAILDESARLYGLTSADDFAAQPPVERLLEPSEVAALVVWLAGPGGAAVTGASLAVDGGLGL